MNNFDEYQIITRQKTAYRALIITLILVFINGMIADYYMWAPSPIQALFIITIPTMYFSARTIFKNAYLGNRTKHPALNGALFLCLGLFCLAESLSRGLKEGLSYYVANGRLQNTVSSPILAVFFLYISALILIKCILDKNS